MSTHVLVFFVLFTCSFVSAGVQRHSAEFQERVVNGTDTTIETYPYHVSIQTLEGSHLCNGCLIAEDIVVTTAECLPYHAGSLVAFARLGNSQSHKTGELVHVASHKVHEAFNSTTMAYDIAVLKLSSPVRFTAKLHSIALAAATPAMGARALLVSWGVNCYEFDCSSTAPVLQELPVDIVDVSVCASDTVEMQSSMLCGSAEGHFNACQGDSGAPLVLDNKLVALASWNPNCSEENVPGIYTNVAALREWILETAAQL